MLPIRFGAALLIELGSLIDKFGGFGPLVFGFEILMFGLIDAARLGVFTPPGGFDMFKDDADLIAAVAADG